MLISERFSPGLITILRPYSRRILYGIQLLLSLAGATLVLLKKVRAPLILFTWTAGYFIAYTLLGVSRYPWYYAPLVPAFIALVGLGLTGLHQFLTRILAGYPHQLPGLIAGILVLTLGGGQLVHLLQIRDMPDARRMIYRAIGEWLAQNTSESDLVGTLEVGTMGYYSSRPMLDFAGLVQPEVGARLGPDSTYEDAALWAIETYHPQYLVLLSGLYPELESKYISQNCRLVKKFMGEDYRFSGEMDIYHCAFAQE